MPIITPAFPSQNATYNVSLSTRNAMLTEFEKALIIINAVTDKNSGTTWKRLFKQFNFFKAYTHFLQI